MVTLLTMVLLLLLLLHLLLMMVASLLLLLLTTPTTPTHSHTFTRWLTITIGHVCSASPIVPLVFPSISVPRFVLLFLVVFRQELSLWIRDREVSKDIRGWIRLLLEVTICHGSLTGKPLCGVHDQQFLQQLESLGVRFDPVSVHVLQQGTVHVRGALEVLRKNYIFHFNQVDKPSAVLGAQASSSCLPNPSPAKCSYRNCYC